MGFLSRFFSDGFQGVAIFGYGNTPAEDALKLQRAAVQQARNALTPEDEAALDYTSRRFQEIVTKLHNDIDAIDVRCFEACQSVIKKHVGINMLVSSFFSFQFLSNVRPKPATPIRVMVAFGVGSVVAFVTGMFAIEDAKVEMLALPTPLGSAARDAFHRKAPKSRLLEAVDEYAKSAQAMIPLEGPVDINNPAASRGPPKAAIRREVDTVEPSGAHDTELALESAIDTGENNAEVQFASLNRGDRVPAATSSARTSQPPVVVRARGGLRGDDRGDSEWPDRFYEADDEGGNDHKTGQGDDRGQRGRNAGNPRTQQPKNSTGYGNYYEHGDRVGTGYTGRSNDLSGHNERQLRSWEHRSNDDRLAAERGLAADQQPPAWWTDDDIRENALPFTDSLYNDGPETSPSQQAPGRGVPRDGRFGRPNQDPRARLNAHAQHQKPRTWDDVRREAAMKP
eukprot:INCI816.1.p1 GENE.INCI816.1~~INCI816.1.p1  ORF type:complete len:454 (-),score=86.52 INCI816.1:175-1536(-)